MQEQPTPMMFDSFRSMLDVLMTRREEKMLEKFHHKLEKHKDEVGRMI